MVATALDHRGVDVADREQAVSRCGARLADEAGTVEVPMQDVSAHQRPVDEELDGGWHAGAS
jgi:hypothetical protein